MSDRVIEILEEQLELLQEKIDALIEEKKEIQSAIKKLSEG